MGVCSESNVEDWWVDPPPLADECAAPNLPSAKQQASELEAVGVRVVNNLNVELPSMRVGHNRWQAARGLAQTLANDARWYAFGSTDDESFMAVNMFGVWFAVEDVPGWDWELYQEGSETRLRVNDPCADKSYRFLTTDGPDGDMEVNQNDYAFRGAKLINVHQPADGASQRTFDYQGSTVAGDLIRQKETADPDTKIEYAYATQGDQLLVTVTGTSPDGTQQAQTRFDPPVDPNEPGTRPLVEATVTGGGASRLYEWYPDDDNPDTKYDRKLKRVSDAAGNVLAEFAYDSQGRLIERGRGSAAQGNYQLVAEYIYEEGAPDSMEARFYVDDTYYQVAVRTFSGRNEVTSITEYEELASGGALPGGTVAVTTFDYHTPPKDMDPGDADPLYHSVCNVGGEDVVVSRCVEKTWPGGLTSEYTFFDGDCHFLPVESYAADPDLVADPPANQKYKHTTKQWSNGAGGAWGIWQTTLECDESHDACADLTYNTGGFLTRRDEPLINVGVYTGFRAFRTRTYDSKHRIDYETRNDGSGAAITIDYGYDVYDNVNRRTESPGADQIEWLFTHDAFGQESLRTDPDGYVTRQVWNCAGLLTGTYTHASGASGPVIRQTDYVYVDGRLTEVWVADDDGAFALDAPATWVVTTYGYDDYGRVVSKTVTPGNHVTTYEYDVQDRITRITYPDGIWKDVIRNGRGQIVETQVGPDPVLVCTYAYDLNGSLISRSCQGCPDCATETTYQYDTYNRRTAEIRPNGTTHFEYDNAGQVTRQYVVDAETSLTLSETRSEYDNLGRPWRTRELATPGGAPNDNADRITEIGFDQAGNTTLQRRKATAGDAETIYAFDFANRRISMTDAEGGLTTYDHDGRGNVVFIEDPVDNEARFVFDGGGRQTEETRYEGATLDLRVASEYDSRDNRIRETAYDAGGTPLTQKRWEYDELGRNTRRVQMADPGSAAAVSLAVDRATDLTYDAGSDRVDTETTYAGDPPQPRTTAYDYDDIGRLTLRTDAEGNTELRAYTVHSRVEAKTLTEPPLVARSYTYGYDNLGRMTSEVADGPPALTTTRDYDALGRLIRTVDAEGIATEYTYDAFDGQTWVIQDADGVAPRQTESQYDQFGYLTLQRTWDGQGLTETTTYQNDKLGRRTQIDFCDGGAWAYVYDDAGRMTQRTDPRGQITTYGHNWRGQVLTKHLGGQPVGTFDYTPLGWMAFAECDANNRVTFEHDGFGQVTSETQTFAGASKTITNDYNQAGDRTLLGYPADTGATLTFDHDGLRQTTAIHRNGQLLVVYDYAGRFLTDRAVRTTSPTETWIRHHVGYDVHRRKTLITNSADVGGNVTELDSYEYTYDAVGNRLSADITGNTGIADAVTFGYDDFHRLTSAIYDSDTSTELFEYDLLGNRLTYDDRAAATTAYTHDCVNEYTAITPGAVAPQHDDAGNLTRTETGYSLAYDYEQRLAEVRDPNNTALATFTYDALGRRVQQVTDGGTTRFVYEGGADGSGHRVIAEYDAAGTLQRYYVEGPTYVDEHVLLHEASGSAAGEYYYLHAGLYSITGLADEVGEAVARYTYDAYGLPTVLASPGCLRANSNCDAWVNNGDLDAFVLALSDPAAWHATYSCDYFCVNDVNGDGWVNAGDIDPFIDCVAQQGCGVIAGAPPNPYLFTGRRLDLDLRDEDGSLTGQPGRPLLVLYDYRARAYDPFHGRFHQRDPALYAESLNLYQYALSNPQGRMDPGGTFSYGDVMGAVSIGARLYSLYDTSVTIRNSIRDFASGMSLRNVMMGLSFDLAADLAVGKTLDFLVDVAGPAIRKMNRKVVASVRGGRRPVDIGKAGEAAAGIPPGPKKRIPSLSGKAQFRIPDELAEGEFLKEVKNVADRLGFTGQLEDFFLYARSMGIEFILVTRKTTTLTGDLIKYADRGWITHLPILD